MNIKTIGEKNQRGFTLVELLISSFVLVVVVGSAIFALRQAQMMSTESRLRLLAIHAGRSTVETIKNTALTSVSSISTAALVPADLTNGSITITTNPANVSGVTIATVTVTVNWTGPKNMARSLQISTMRSVY